MDLRGASVTERLFDRRLQEIPFPPAINVIADRLYSTNHARAMVTAEMTKALTFRPLHAFTTRLSAQNAVVEVQVRLIRRALGLPPPDTSKWTPRLLVLRHFRV